MKIFHALRHRNRHRENFRDFYRTEKGFWLDFTDFNLNMIIHKSFTGPTHFLSANVRVQVSLAVFAVNVN